MEVNVEFNENNLGGFLFDILIRTSIVFTIEKVKLNLELYIIKIFSSGLGLYDTSRKWYFEL